MEQKRIGVWVYPGDPFWIQTYEAIQRTSGQIGAELVAFDYAETFTLARTFNPYPIAEEILSHQLDALIVTVMPRTVTKMLLNAGVPIVQLGETNLRHPRLVSPDGLADAAAVAGQYIGEQLGGKGRVDCIGAFLEDPLEEDLGESRYQGFLKGIKSFPGIRVERVAAYWDYQRTYLTLLEDFKHRQGPPPDAVFGVSDWIALAARDAGRESGFFGEAPFVVGLNGDPLALAAVVDGSMRATVETCSEDYGELALKVAYDAACGLPLPDHLHYTIRLITAENIAATATRKLLSLASLPNRLVGFNRERQAQRFHQLETSAAVLRKMGAILDQDVLVHTIADLIREAYGYREVQVYLVDDRGKPYPLIDAKDATLLDDYATINDILAGQQAILIPDLGSSLRYHLDPALPWMRSRVALPIHIGDETIGVLDLRSDFPIVNLIRQSEGLQLLADMLGVAIQNARLYQEARSAQTSAERANQIKTRLLANVGHEMRTPLNVILGYAQAILKRQQSGSHTKNPILERDIQFVYQSGEHLLRMINDLLDLSRAEIGALELYLETIDPRPVLEEVFNSFSHANQTNQDIHWQLDLPGRLPMVMVDSMRLKQILLNLLSNALKFTRSGEIRLSAQVEPPFLHVSLSDTGEGIPFERQERLFEPFTIGRSRRRGEGIGLGLSITRHLVMLHGGLLTLESQPEQGSTFHVYLPLPGLSGRAALQGDSGQKTEAVLVLSAKRETSPAVVEICRKQNIPAVPVCTFEELKAFLAQHYPAALAWDLDQASSGDWLIFHHLSNQVELSRLPFLLFSTRPEAQAGLVNVMLKPTSGETLVETIKQLIPNSQQQSTILIVDDDAQARQSYCKLVGRYLPDFQVQEVANGEEALRMLGENTPALVILDLLMPHVNGFEVLDEMRRNPNTRSVPVIVISGKMLNFNDIQRLDYTGVCVQGKQALTESELGSYLQARLSEGQISSSNSPLLRQALAYLEQNYTRPITRKDVADAVNVSENYFTEVFRQEMHLTPWEYLSRLRIRAACQMLLDTDDSIKAVAMRIGYNDPAYFTRVFHKMIGVSPRNYRRSAGASSGGDAVYFPEPPI